uniref:Transmembrane protein n=1 Tax=Romanomermis culicivorax TaxID=13658 RepID=A0A915KJZ9_ROMCU
MQGIAVSIILAAIVTIISIVSYIFVSIFIVTSGVSASTYQGHDWIHIDITFDTFIFIEFEIVKTETDTANSKIVKPKSENPKKKYLHIGRPVRNVHSTRRGEGCVCTTQAKDLITDKNWNAVFSPNRVISTRAKSHDQEVDMQINDRRQVAQTICIAMECYRKKET